MNKLIEIAKADIEALKARLVQLSQQKAAIDQEISVLSTRASQLEEALIEKCE